MEGKRKLILGLVALAILGYLGFMSRGTEAISSAMQYVCWTTIGVATANGLEHLGRGISK